MFFQDKGSPIIPILNVISRFFGRGLKGGHRFAHRLARRSWNRRDDDKVKLHADFLASIQAGENPLTHWGKLTGGLISVLHLVLADEDIVGLAKLLPDETGVRRGPRDEGDDIAKHTDKPFVFSTGGIYFDHAAHRDLAVRIQHFQCF